MREYFLTVNCAAEISPYLSINPGGGCVGDGMIRLAFIRSRIQSCTSEEGRVREKDTVTS